MYQKESSCLGAEESRRSMVLSSSPLYHHPEVRLLVPDFTVSLGPAVHVVCYFLFSLIFAPSLYIYVVLFNGIPKAAREAKKYIEKRKEEKMISQKRELHELPCLLNLGLLDPGSTTLISLSWSPFCFFFWNIICSDSCYELSCFSASLFPASLIHPYLIYSARWCLQFVLCVLKGRVSQDSLPPFPEQQTHLGPW